MDSPNSYTPPHNDHGTHDNNGMHGFLNPGLNVLHPVHVSVKIKQHATLTAMSKKLALFDVDGTLTVPRDVSVNVFQVLIGSTNKNVDV